MCVLNNINSLFSQNSQDFKDRSYSSCGFSC